MSNKGFEYANSLRLLEFSIFPKNPPESTIRLGFTIIRYNFSTENDARKNFNRNFQILFFLLYDQQLRYVRYTFSIFPTATERTFIARF